MLSSCGRARCSFLNESASSTSRRRAGSRPCILFASLVMNADTPTPEAIRPVTLVNSSEDQDRAVVIEWEPALDNPWVGTLTVGLPMGFIEAAYRAQTAGQI